MSLAELRARTGPSHERLDHRLNLFSSVHTRQDYRDHLLRFYQIYHFVEGELGRFPEWNALGIHWAERKKCDLLRADLHFLGVDSTQTETPTLPASLPPLDDFAASVGSLYVLEGSTLGAQFISRHFGPKLGLTAGGGMSFHFGYGQETGTKWKEFCTALEKFFHQQPQAKEKTLRSAVTAFQAVEDTLCESLPTPATKRVP